MKKLRITVDGKTYEVEVEVNAKTGYAFISDFDRE